MRRPAFKWFVCNPRCARPRALPDIARHVMGLVLCALMIVSAQPSEALETARDIEIIGNTTVERQAIEAHLKVRPGETFDAAAADRALKALYATGLFSDVRIDRAGSRIVVHVVETPIVSSVSFSGNKEVEKSKLTEMVQTKTREHYAAGKAHADVLRIRDHYLRLGRLATTVEVKTVPKANGTVEAVFTIKEAAVTKIERIAFVGNRAFTQGQLRGVISTSESGWFDILKQAAFYDKERLESDGDLVRQYYANNGFPDAKVISVDGALNEEGSAYVVTFKLDEGDRYVFGPSHVESSIAKVDTRMLRNAINLPIGGPYNQEKIEKAHEALSQVLSEQGHVFARVKPLPRRAGNVITMVFSIEEGKPAYVERIDVTGNKKTKDEVIRRELRLAEGDPVNTFLIERAKKRVKSLGFFKSVAVKPKPGSAPDKLVVSVEVVEDETMQVGFGVGYSMTEGIIGDAAITENNLFGNGQKLRLKVAGSFTRFQADIGFTEPRFLGSNVAAGFDLFYKDVDYTKEASYKSLKAGGALRASYPITDTFTGSVNYTFVRNQIYDVGPNASAAIKEAVPGFPQSASDTYYTSSVGYGVAYDTRDNKKMPTKGVYFSLSQDLAGLGGDVRYIRSGGEGRAYYAVNDDITLMGRAQGGIISGWGGQDVRLLDMYYKGNDLVRGFANAGIGPRDTLSANSDALGGRMFVGSSVEALFQIPGVPRETGLRGAVFFDAGSLWGVNKTAAALPGLAGGTPALRASAGVGLAWDSPIGNLRVDYAYPIFKQAFDKTQALSFGLAPF